MITLIIKGDMVAAALAASAHSVKLCSMHMHPRFRECIAYADSTALRNVVAWFCEPGEAPFPDGALTFYSQGHA
jgi:hypothetical protein